MARGGFPGAHLGMAPTPDDVAEKLLGSLLGCVEVVSIYLGDRLGWYRYLATDGPATAPGLPIEGFGFWRFYLLR